MAWLGICWISYERGGPYLLYSYVGIRTGRFLCSVLTLEATMSGEVHSRGSRMFDYGGQVRRVGLRAERSVELDHEWVDSWKYDNP